MILLATLFQILKILTILIIIITIIRWRTCVSNTIISLTEFGPVFPGMVMRNATGIAFNVLESPIIMSALSYIQQHTQFKTNFRTILTQ